jgi:hypothetical protein
MSTSSERRISLLPCERALKVGAPEKDVSARQPWARLLRLTASLLLAAPMSAAVEAGAGSAATPEVAPLPQPTIYGALDEMMSAPGDRWCNPLAWMVDRYGSACVPGLVACLADPNPGIRANAIWSLACLGTSGEGVEWAMLYVPGAISQHPVPVDVVLGPILAQAGSPEPIVRREVVRQLHGMLANGRLAAPALRALAGKWLPMLTDTDETARHYAALLAQAVPELRDRVPAASVDWIDGDAEVRAAPPRAWKLLGDGSPAAVAAVLRLASASAPAQRCLAITALVDPIARDRAHIAPDVIAAVQAGLQDDDPTVRRAAVQALGATRDARYLPILRQRLSDPARLVRSQDLLALWLLHDDSLRAGLPRIAQDLVAADASQFLALLVQECPHDRPRSDADLVALPLILDHFDDPLWAFSRGSALRHLSRLLGDAFRASFLPGDDNIEGMVGGPRAFSTPPDDCSIDDQVRPACLVPVLAVAAGRIPGPRYAAADLLCAAAQRAPGPMLRIRDQEHQARLAADLALASIGDPRGLPDLVASLPTVADPVWHRALVRALVMSSRTMWMEPVAGHRNAWQDVVHPWTDGAAYRQIRSLLLHGSSEDVRTAFGAFWYPLGDVSSICPSDQALLLPAIRAECAREHLTPPP